MEDYKTILKKATKEREETIKAKEYLCEELERLHQMNEKESEPEQIRKNIEMMCLIKQLV